MCGLLYKFWSMIAPLGIPMIVFMKPLTIKKIKNLGMKVEDAEVLFKSKIDWCAVYSDNKIYCVEPGCDYVTKIDKGELTNHMINVHNYVDHPCGYDHCDYVAYSKVR